MKWQDIPINILFENEDLLALDKPPGVLSQGTVANKEDHIYYAAQKFLEQRDGHTYLALHHRLDKKTSGILLFAKSKKGNHILSSAFQNKTIQKTYIAKTSYQDGFSTGKKWRIENHLGPVRKEGRTTLHGSVRAGGQKAITDFEILQSSQEKGLLIQAQPITGRTHQIRVHLSEFGLPILGDPLYSKESEKYPRLFLHAQRIELPLEEETLRLESSLDPSFT